MNMLQYCLSEADGIQYDKVFNGKNVLIPELYTTFSVDS